MALLNFIQNEEAVVILSIALILLAGFLMTRLTKLAHLPNVTGYILAGVLIGPYVLHLIPDSVVEHMDFVTDIALAYIAFGVGEYFKKDRLRQNGMRIVIITLLEALMASLVVTLTMMFVFHLSVAFSLLLGAIASATAPASTIMTIRQYKAKGEFVDTLLQVVALDDAVALIAFSICAAVAAAIEDTGEGFDALIVLLPLLYNILALIAAVGLGFLLKWIITDRRSRDHRLVLTNAVIFILTAVCTAVDISPLLPCMVMGTIYTNITKKGKLFKQMNRFSPPIMLMFFVLSGMRLNVPMLAGAGIIGICYFFVRILGKYAGAWVGARITNAPPAIRNYLGLGLIPQAGVSIGLAVLGQRLLPEKLGMMLSTIILSSGVLYEMIGPACAKASLRLSHSIQTGLVR